MCNRSAVHAVKFDGVLEFKICQIEKGVIVIQDYFTGWVPEGRECQNEDWVEESVQGRAVWSLPQRREGKCRRSGAVGLNYDLKVRGSCLLL